MQSRILIVLTTAFFVAGCLPKHLRKYRDPVSQKSEISSDTNRSSYTVGAAKKKKRKVRKKPAPTPEQPPVYQVDNRTYRFQAGMRDVWDSAVTVLLSNYNLTIVNKGEGILTTEWDTFYLDSKVYRNRISMRVRNLGRGTVDLMIHNNVEMLQDGTAAGAIGAIWLPSADGENEISRIVRNMSVVLNLPAPQTSSGMVATKPAAR